MLEMQGGFMGPDPAALAKRFGTGQASNYADYSSAEFDALCEQGAATGDQAKRAEYYKKAQALLVKDLPYVPIVTFAGYDANRSDYINLPIDGTGKWGWAEFTYTDLAAN